MKIAQRSTKNSQPQIRRRPDSRIVRSALDEVKAIQTLLADVYKDVGDGRTLLRELVQNADDAGAERLMFRVLENGWPEARNSLLKGPALVVANDGPFPEKDHEALHQALGGSKADEAGKIGRFGIGLKSVFHICEAIVYVGAEEGLLRPGALNPWAGTGPSGNGDPLHSDWDSVADEDLERLLGMANALLGGFHNGLLQWIPLRQPCHLDRAQDRQYGLGQTCPGTSDITTWFERPESFALLLAQCGHLSSIIAGVAPDPRELTHRELARVARPGFSRPGWIGRYEEDTKTVNREFEGRIEDGGRGWSIVGVEALGSERLRGLRDKPDWPTEPYWRDGRCVWVPRKALTHAAITVLRPGESVCNRPGARLRWSVFLPLDNDPMPRPSGIVEGVGPDHESGAWEILLHGYFWPSHDRKSIPGVTHDEAGTGEAAVRVLWNQAVRDEILLPLLPKALEKAVENVQGDAARSLLEIVKTVRTVQSHLASVTRCHILLPLVREDGLQWKALEPDEHSILSIPAWSEALQGFRMAFLARLEEHVPNIVFIDRDAPRFGGDTADWPPDWVKICLGCVPSGVFHGSRELLWVKALLRHLLGSLGDATDSGAAIVADWLFAQIGEGALGPTAEGPATEEQQELRSAWMEVFAVLPKAWLVSAPLTAQRAVVELAKENVIGAGLIPIPLGSKRDPDWSPRPDPTRLDGALLSLGNRLLEDGEMSQRLRRSRLLLAEALLSVRGPQPLSEELSRLPLLRARRLPEDRDEAWSIADLQRQSIRHRVFAKPADDGDEEGSTLDVPSDFKKAVVELAEALGEAAWLVDWSVASAADVPTPTPNALTRAVLSADALIQSTPENRLGLLLRLDKPEVANDPDGRRAMIALLTGRSGIVGDSHQLYYVRSLDSEIDANKKSLEILLRLLERTFCSLEASLVEPLPTVLTNSLGVKMVDSGVLHALLQESLDGASDWSILEQDEVIHLLRHLHGASQEDRRRWRLMPLHRRVGGDRGICNDRTLRVVGGLRLPPELEDEVPLLEPDPEVTEYYLDTPCLDDDGILRVMLMSQQPHQFSDRILRALRPGGDDHVILPHDPRLRDLLRTATWVPHRDGNTGMATEKLLLLPDGLRSAVSPLAREGALGDRHLSEDVAPGFWDDAEDVLREILGRPSALRQVQRLADALDSSMISHIADGAYVLLPDPSRVDVLLVEEGLRSPLAGSHPGWALVRAAASGAGVADGQSLDGVPAALRETLLGVARALCASIPASRKISTLMSLAAARPAKDSSTGRLFRNILESFAQTPDFFDCVLPNIELPTQDGNWRSTRDIARSTSGVARRHRLLPELRDALGLSFDTPVQAINEPGTLVDTSTVDILARYFKPWLNRLPNGAVGAFLALLGDGNNETILNLAQEWLGEDVGVEGMRDVLAPANGQDPFASVRVFVSSRIASGQRVKALNLRGELVEMDAGSDHETIFATDPVRTSSNYGYFWTITLRAVDPQNQTAQDLIGLLGNTVEWWAVRVLHIEQQTVRSWWSRWGTGSQAQVGPVQASILAHLPLTLHQLDVHECAELKNALQDAQRAQRRREQATAAQLGEAITRERSVLKKLSSLIQDAPEYQEFIWARVQETMKRFGYSEDSVLLELAQNADDALAQTAEIPGRALTPAACRLIVRVAEYDEEATIDVIHYGRPINDTGGAAFPEGRDRQWDQDLYFMMLLNLSGKPGEISGRSTPASTTGRFGLGFKSVHLVSKQPSIVSGFLAFSIAAGLLPQEQPVPDDPDLQTIDGHHATRVRLPLRDSELVRKMFYRFDYARTLLPAFARKIREVVVDGGPHAGASTFDGEPIEGAPGWSVGRGTVGLTDHSQWRLLRFRPADAGLGNGTEALVIGLREGLPEPFPAEMPFLWNVTPTSEGWGCGYAVNGPLKLDPGRTHVSLEDAGTRMVADSLGEALGSGLVKLHDALMDGGAHTTMGLPVGENATKFLASLWRVLVGGIDNRDNLRKGLLLLLHGSGRGVSLWMNTRAVVPSGLPPPFPHLLPPLTPNTHIKVAAGGLDNSELCRAIAQVDELALLLSRHQIVSSDVAQQMQPLLNIPPRQFFPWELLRELTEQWDHRLTPERLRALRPLAVESVWKAISNDPHSPPWHSKLLARSVAGSFVPLRSLLMPRELAEVELDETVKDELLRAGFAPDTQVLDPAYIGCNDDLMIFQRLRVRHEIDAAKMASWCMDLPTERRPSVLRYLLQGKLQYELLERLVPLEARPQWLAVYEEVHRMLEDLGDHDWRTQRFLAAIFPDQFKHTTDTASPEPPLPDPVRRNFFERLEEWWNDQNVRHSVIESYEARAWPDFLRREGIAEGLMADSVDHWLGLLVLGACRSLGRAQAGHHRSFLELVHREGWWKVFKASEDTTAWMEMLRSWQDRAVAALIYPRWMSLFPSIYQLSRYLEKYRRLLRSAGRRSAELYRVTSLLSPRVDEALTGAGQHFDAPPAPLNMGLHWVLRELVRLQVLDGEHIFPDCWVPSEQLLSFLRPLGMNLPDNNASNPERARAVFEFLAIGLNTEKPNLHRAFDIPLCHIDEHVELRRKLGLEDNGAV